MDVVYLGVVAVFFGVTFGLVRLCSPPPGGAAK
jgi:hypothetical protein